MKRNLPKVRVTRPRRPKSILPAPHKPRIDTGDEAEILAGTVQGMKASAAEERYARALDKLKSVDYYEFRYTVGAPRGLPGYKEVDFVVSSHGVIYLEEIDSPFTHRNKQRADVLHDAIVLNEFEKLGFTPYPSVIHTDGEMLLQNQKTADATAKNRYG